MDSEYKRRASFCRAMERFSNVDPFALHVVRFMLVALLDYSRQLQPDQRIAFAEAIRNLADEIENGL